MRDCFQAFKTYTKQEQKIKLMQLVTVVNKAKQAIQFWRQYSFEKRRNADIVAYFVNRKYVKLRCQVFIEIKNARQTEQ
jgi:hypothetical protein